MALFISYFIRHLHVMLKILLDIRPAPDIRIQYPAFRLAGCPAGWVSGKISIWCIPIFYPVEDPRRDTGRQKLRTGSVIILSFIFFYILILPY
jgi:hypothetical protein